jgi:ribosomal protein S19E (S16A)
MERKCLCRLRSIRQYKEYFTVSVEEKQHNEIIYLMALSVLRKLYTDGKVRAEILERINQKNAEKMGCTPIPIK